MCSTHLPSCTASHLSGWKATNTRGDSGSNGQLCKRVRGGAARKGCGTSRLPGVEGFVGLQPMVLGFRATGEPARCNAVETTEAAGTLVGWSSAAAAAVCEKCEGCSRCAHRGMLEELPAFSFLPFTLWPDPALHVVNLPMQRDGAAGIIIIIRNMCLQRDKLDKTYCRANWLIIVANRLRAASIISVCVEVPAAGKVTTGSKMTAPSTIHSISPGVTTGTFWMGGCHCGELLPWSRSSMRVPMCAMIGCSARSLSHRKRTRSQSGTGLQCLPKLDNPAMRAHKSVVGGASAFLARWYKR